MLATAAIYSVTAALFKLAILHSDPAFFGVAYPLAAIGLMSAGLPFSRRRVMSDLCGRYGWWLTAGFCLALSTICLALGVKLAPITYLVSVKRLSLLFSVLLGGLWLRERPLLPRFVAAVLMCGGVALIALKG